MTILKVSEKIKENLKNPLGKLFRTTYEVIDQAQAKRREGKQVVTVGDRTTINFMGEDFIPDLAIIDGKEMRGSAPKIDKSPFKHIFSVENPPGTINTDISKLIEKALANPPSLILVDGEEDLLAMLVFTTVEKDTIVFYGQPHQGIVAVDLTRDRVEFFYSLWKEISEG